MKLGPGLVVSQSSTNSNFNDATADSAFDGDEGKQSCALLEMVKYPVVLNTVHSQISRHVISQ